MNYYPNNSLLGDPPQSDTITFAGASDNMSQENQHMTHNASYAPNAIQPSMDKDEQIGGQMKNVLDPSTQVLRRFPIEIEGSPAEFSGDKEASCLIGSAESWKYRDTTVRGSERTGDIKKGIVIQVKMSATNPFEFPIIIQNKVLKGNMYTQDGERCLMYLPPHSEKKNVVVHVADTNILSSVGKYSGLTKKDLEAQVVKVERDDVVLPYRFIAAKSSLGRVVFKNSSVCKKNAIYSLGKGSQYQVRESGDYYLCPEDIYQLASESLRVNALNRLPHIKMKKLVFSISRPNCKNDWLSERGLKKFQQLGLLSNVLEMPEMVCGEVEMRYRLHK